jgi:uncharacterized protein
MRTGATLYTGDVVHKRLRPQLHALSYRVFSLLVDIDDLPGLAQRVRFLAHNGRNLVAINDRDHGTGDGRPLAHFARDTLRAHGIDTGDGRIHLLTYPRILGYVFNPISVFYCYDTTGALAALIYEVNNTFGGRTHYVIRAGVPDGRVYAHGCGKTLYVSPFNTLDGAYSFRVTDPGADLTLAVMLRDREGALVKTRFGATAAPLTDRTLMAALARLPFMTLKVMAAIHVEALKLWLKGVPLVRRPRPTTTPAAPATNTTAYVPAFRGTDARD